MYQTFYCRLNVASVEEGDHNQLLEVVKKTNSKATLINVKYIISKYIEMEKSGEIGKSSMKFNTIKYSLL